MSSTTKKILTYIKTWSLADITHLVNQSYSKLGVYVQCPSGFLSVYNYLTQKLFFVAAVKKKYMYSLVWFLFTFLKCTVKLKI